MNNQIERLKEIKTARFAILMFVLGWVFGHDRPEPVFVGVAIFLALFSMALYFIQDDIYRKHFGERHDG